MRSGGACSRTEGASGLSNSLRPHGRSENLGLCLSPCQVLFFRLPLQTSPGELKHPLSAGPLVVGRKRPGLLLGCVAGQLAALLLAGAEVWAVPELLDHARAVWLKLPLAKHGAQKWGPKSRFYSTCICFWDPCSCASGVYIPCLGC